MNETVTLLNLNYIYTFYTWLIVMFCPFVNALHKWNVTAFQCHWQITSLGSSRTGSNCLFCFVNEKSGYFPSI